MKYDGTATMLQEEPFSLASRSPGTSDPEASATSMEAAKDPNQNQTPWIF